MHHGSAHALLSYVWSIFSRLIWFSKRSQTILFRAIYRPTGEKIANDPIPHSSQIYDEFQMHLAKILALPLRNSYQEN